MIIHADESERAFGNRLRGDLVGRDARDVAVLEEDRLDRRAVGRIRRLGRDAAAERRTPHDGRRHRLSVSRHGRADIHDIWLVRCDRKRLLGAHAGCVVVELRLPSATAVTRFGGHDERRGGERGGQRGVVDAERQWERRVRRRVTGDHLVGTTGAVAVFFQLPALDRRAARGEHRRARRRSRRRVRGRACRDTLPQDLALTASGWPEPARARSARSPPCSASAGFCAGLGRHGKHGLVSVQDHERQQHRDENASFHLRVSRGRREPDRNRPRRTDDNGKAAASPGCRREAPRGSRWLPSRRRSRWAGTGTNRPGTGRASPGSHG